MLLLGCVLLIISLAKVTEANVDCLSCENYEVTYNSGITNPFTGRSDPTCETRTTSTTTCSQGEKCGMVKGNVALDLSFLGRIEAKITVRRCMVDPGLGLGCHQNANLRSILNDVLKFLVDLGTVTVDGQLCLYNGPYASCPAGTFALPSIFQSNYSGCLHWGVIAGVVVGILILLGCCIACCYCCCCRSSSNTRGTVLQTRQQHGIIMVNSHTPAPGTSPVAVPPPVYQSEDAVANPIYDSAPMKATGPAGSNYPHNYKY